MIHAVFLKWTSLSKTCLNTLHIFRVRTLRIAKFLRIVAGKWVYGSSSSASKGALCNNCSTAAKSLKHFTLLYELLEGRLLDASARSVCGTYTRFFLLLFFEVFILHWVQCFKTTLKASQDGNSKRYLQLEQKKIERCKGRVGPSSAQENQKSKKSYFWGTHDWLRRLSRWFVASTHGRL